MVLRGTSGPFGALLELSIAPSRPSEALLVPLVLNIWVAAGALGAHSKALWAPWIPRGP